MTQERLPRGAALERIRHHLRTHAPRSSQVNVKDALGLVCARDLFAAHASPAAPKSSVDGYALASAATRNASDAAPARLALAGEIRPSTASPLRLDQGQAVAILTGGRLPEGADCVAPAEEAEVQGDVLLLKREIRPQEHVRQPGADLKAGSPIVRRGEDLTPAVLAALTVSGILQVEAFLPPRVRVLALGNELSALGAAPASGQLPADNLLLAAGLLRQRGLMDIQAEVCGNDLAVITRELAESGAWDCVVSAGGTGPGQRDFILEASSLAGFTPLFQGLALTPGKSCFAAVRDRTLLFALPGTPWAVFSLLHALVLPAACWLRGRTLPVPSPILSRPSLLPPLAQPGWEKLVPCTISARGAELQAHPLVDRTREMRLDMIDAQGLLIVSSKHEEGDLLPMIPIWEHRRGHRPD